VDRLARRQTEHGSGLGRYRRVVERTFAWLHNVKRLLVHHERRADVHRALLALACLPRLLPAAQELNLK
jgi:transposase